MTETIYIRALKWASDRGTAGFTIKQLYEAVEADANDQAWISRMLLGQINGEPALIAHNNKTIEDGSYIYYLSASGTAAAVDYFELQEARKTGEEARKLSMWAIWIGIVVGILQIIAGVVIGAIQIYYAKHPPIIYSPQQEQGNLNTSTTTEETDTKGHH